MFLNDWGCAVNLKEIKEPISFSGCLEFAPQHLLGVKSFEEICYIPKAKDDLEMVVKCFYSTVFPKHTFHILYGTHTCKELKDFWDEHLASEYWANLIKAAKEKNYSRMQTMIKKLMK